MSTFVNFDQHDDGEERPRAVGFGRTREPMMGKKKRPDYRRQGSAPQNSGMCRRSNKKWTWGVGRSARMLDARGQGFAGCIALLLALAASVASAAPVVTLDLGLIGNPGNSTKAGNGFGTVGTYYQMAKTETTNSQYVAFLNNSAAGKTNLLGVFSGSSAGNAAYRIQQSGTFGNYTYSLKSADSGDKPVNFVSWWSAARFANWLSNGADLAASTETGSYTLNSGTSGPLVARNSGAIYYLPSADEWTKAAYYNATANNYYRFASVSSTNAALNGTLPAAGNLSTDPTAFAATWNAVSAGVTPVGYFSTVTSPYGMYDMVGNVNEMTDTANSANTSQYALFSGSYASTQMQIEMFDSLTAPSFVNGTTENAPRGFRIAAVPEPSTLVLASIGLMVGLVGWSGWLKRRTIG